jgi:hypothetical protein
MSNEVLGRVLQGYLDLVEEYGLDEDEEVLRQMRESTQRLAAGGSVALAEKERLEQEMQERTRRKLQESNRGKRRKAENERLLQAAVQDYVEKEWSSGVAAGRTTDLSASEEQTIDEMVAEYTGRAVETPARDQAADLSEQEQEDRGGEAKESYFGVENMRYLGAEEMLKIAAEDDGSLPPDEALKEDLLKQNHAEHFGEADPSVSEEDLWGALSATWGLEAK